MRYQIKIVDSDLTDLVHEIATSVVTRVIAAAGGEVMNLRLYSPVFQACKDILRRYVRGFHVCGCRPHCDLESRLTDLMTKAPPPVDISKMNFRSPRINRYVLALDVPLKKFTKELEVRLLKVVTEHTIVKNWRGLLFPIIRDAVENTLGKYVYVSPSCNRGEYICEMGACTEFDPWEKVKPKESA